MSRRFYKAVKTGWKMTEEQARWFWRAWAEVCAFRGWDKLSTKERDAKRHEVLDGLGFASIKDVDKGAGFDRLKKRLQELKGTVYVATPATGKTVASDEDEGDRRRLLWRVAEIEQKLRDAEYPAHSFAGVFRDFGLVDGWRGLPDLTEEQLLTLSRTLTRIHGEWMERSEKAAAMAREAVGVNYAVETTPEPDPF